VVAGLSKELQSCAEVLPAELKGFWVRVALAVVELRAEEDKCAAKIAALRSIHQRSVALLEAEHVQASEEVATSLELLHEMVDEAARQLSACAAAAAPLDARARDTLHAGLVCAALRTHAAAEAKAELAPLLAAAEELQAAVKPTGSWLGAVGGYLRGLVGVKRARE